MADNNIYSLLQCKEFTFIYYDNINVSKKFLDVNISLCGCVQYAYILHDKDYDDNGVLKKPHYHVWLKFEKKHSIQRIANLFNIEPNLVERVKSSSSALLRYFLHYELQDKHQYDLNELITNIKNKDDIFSKSSFNENAFYFMVNYLENHKCTLTQLLNVMYINGYGDYVEHQCYLIQCVFRDFINNK